MEPALAQSLFESIQLITNAARTLREKCVTGITANVEVCRANVMNSIGIVTYLNGSSATTTVTSSAASAPAPGRTVRDVVVEMGLMTADGRRRPHHRQLPPRATPAGSAPPTSAASRTGVRADVLDPPARRPRLHLHPGARKGGIAIGFAGGAGVLAWPAQGARRRHLLTPQTVTSDLPLDVIAIIMAVIVAIAAMQVAGGMDALVDLAERILQEPWHLSIPRARRDRFLTPHGGHRSHSLLDDAVITEVAKENDIRTLAPAVDRRGLLTDRHHRLPDLSRRGLPLLDPGEGGHRLPADPGGHHPDDLRGVHADSGDRMMAWDKMRGTTELHTLEIYQERRGCRSDRPTGRQEGREITWAGKRSVAIFLLGLLAVMAYSTAISDKVGLIKDPPMTRDAAIIAIMLTIPARRSSSCGVEPGRILNSSVFGRHERCDLRARCRLAGHDLRQGA